MRITIPTPWLRYDHVGLWGLILWSDRTAVSSLALTALVAWLRPDMSCQQGAPEATFGRRRGSRSSAGAKRGEMIAGVHGEGNVPMSVRTSAYSSAYHYPLKEGSNYTNRDDHNWDRSCAAKMYARLPARHGRHRYLNQVTSTMAADSLFSLSGHATENRATFIQTQFPSTES